MCLKRGKSKTDLVGFMRSVHEQTNEVWTQIVEAFI